MIDCFVVNFLSIQLNFPSPQFNCLVQLNLGKCTITSGSRVLHKIGLFIRSKLFENNCSTFQVFLKQKTKKKTFSSKQNNNHKTETFPLKTRKKVEIEKSKKVEGTI